LKCPLPALDAGRQSVGSLVEVGARNLVTSWAACSDLFGTRKLQPAEAALESLHLTSGRCYHDILFQIANNMMAQALWKRV
jgi:hypothetical protein